MSPLTDHIIETFRTRVPGLFTRHADVYAVGFLIEVDLEPSLVITANREATAERAIPHASSKEEARWNYAFWAHKPFIDMFRYSPGAEMMQKWFDQYDESTHEDEVFDALGKLAVEAAKALHADGTIERVFGRPVPIIFHDLDGRDQMFDWTKAANPNGLAEEFLSCGGGFG